LLYHRAGSETGAPIAARFADVIRKTQPTEKVTMTKRTIAKALNNIRPCNVLVSDGRCIYVDNPETVLVSDTILVIGKHAQGRMVKELAIVAVSHVTGIEPTTPRPLRKVA
jgi:hypothetical protein